MKKKVLILGGTGNVGSYLAKELCNCGHDIILQTTGRSKSKLINNNFKYFKYKAEYKKEFKLQKKIKNIDILINCVGGGGEHLGFMNTKIKKWKDIYNYNLFFVVEIVGLILNHMINKNYGRIIHISSHVFNKGFDIAPEYSSVKSAVNNFSLSTAEFVKNKNITSNVICPQLIENKKLYKKTSIIKFVKLSRIFKTVKKIIDNKNINGQEFILKGR